MASNKIVELTSSTFKEIIQEGITIVDFWAPWSALCRRQTPMMDQIAEMLGDRITVAKLNVDQASELTAEYTIRGIPTIMIFKDGHEKTYLVGVQKIDVLLEELNKLMADKSVAGNDQ